MQDHAKLAAEAAQLARGAIEKLEAAVAAAGGQQPGGDWYDNARKHAHAVLYWLDDQAAVDGDDD